MTGHRVLTGSAGLIGSRLTDGLSADRHWVVGVDSFEELASDMVKRDLPEALRESGWHACLRLSGSLGARIQAGALLATSSGGTPHTSGGG